MKILIAHNEYQYRGGEDTVVDAEIDLLRSRGHEVEVYHRHNSELRAMSAASAAVTTIWSRRTVDDAQRICRAFQPDLIHVHNTFPLISPSLYWFAARHRIPLIQTLHNFRLLCPQAALLRQGSVCEDCIGKAPWRAVTRKCYRNSTLQSAVATGMLMTHRALGTYRNHVTNYIALNAFCRDKFIAGGLPAERICIKPNFAVASKSIDWVEREGGLFVGRLSVEKGLDVLMAAMRMLPQHAIRIIGKGPLEGAVREAFGRDYLGYMSSEQMMTLLRRAAFLVAPSTGIETFGLVAIEAFACGTPVIASRQGGLGELVKDGVTGLLVNPGDASDLAAKIAWAEAHPEQMMEMGRAARAEYEAKYTPECNYRILIRIYENSIAEVRGRAPSPAALAGHHAASESRNTVEKTAS
jgi:glycosyltransferase involved in cell wall biosynthesis